MHVELVEIFRCIAPHRDSWLVASADHTESRVIIDGTLGCPVCGAEYDIRNGVTHFESVTQGRTSSPKAQRLAGNAVGDADAVFDPDLPLRIAALLGATDRAMTFALVGVPLRLASAMQSVAPSRFIVVDALDDGEPLRATGAYEHADAPLAIVRVSGGIPVADRALHGVYAARGNPAEYPRALRARGRLVAPAQSSVPEAINELARDDALWVGERTADDNAAPGTLTQLRRRR